VKQGVCRYGYTARDFDLDPKVKKLSTTRLVKRGSTLRSEKTVNYLPRPFRPNRPLTSREKRMLPLPITACSKWVGLTPFPIGDRKQEVREPLGWWDGFLSSKDFKDTGITPEEVGDYSKWTLISGNWDSNRSVLADMCRPPEYANVTTEQLLECAYKRYDKFGFPSINQIPKPSWLKSVKVNPDAQPGLMSSRYLGPTKEAAYDKAVFISRRIWDKITKSRSCLFDKSLWQVGGRPRRQDVGKLQEGEIAESRIVLMGDFPSSLISGLFAQIYTAAAKKEVVGRPDVENFMGQAVSDGQWTRIKRFVKPGTPVIELDWAKFDSTVIESAMVAGFCLIRSCFPTSKVIDKLFVYMMSGVIYKHIAIKGRFIYVVSRGVPSGTPWTSILDTVVNWILLNYVLMETDLFGGLGVDDYKLGVAGDDTLIAIFDKPLKDFPSFSEIQDTFYRVTNLFVKEGDLAMDYWWGSGPDPEFAPSLLKTTIWKGLPGRRLLDISKSFSCPESKIKGWADVHRVMKGYLMLPIVTPKARLLLEALASYISTQYWEIFNKGPLADIFNEYRGFYSYRSYYSCVDIKTDMAKLKYAPWYLQKVKYSGSKEKAVTELEADALGLEIFGLD